MRIDLVGVDFVRIDLVGAPLTVDAAGLRGSGRSLSS